MKKLMVYATAILMLISVTLKAQDKNTTAMNSLRSIKKSETKAERKEVRKENRDLVSKRSINAFMEDFSDVSNVAWEKWASFDEAIYTQKGIQHKAFYDENSKLIGTTTDETYADLPVVARKEIRKNYKGYHVDKVVYFEDNKYNDQNMLLYGNEFEDADNYFVEMSNKDKNIIIQANPEGEVFFFKELQKEI